jgi:hypothetical protein
MCFILLFVIQPGLEPGTYSLEGYCSNPTELLDHPYKCIVAKNSSDPARARTWDL